MTNRSISMKLAGGFLAITVLAAAIGAAGIFGLSFMSETAEHMYSGMVMPLKDMGQAAEYFQRIRVQIQEAVLYTGDEGRLAAAETELAGRMLDFEAKMLACEAVLTGEEGEALFKEIMDEYDNVMKPGMTAILEGAREAAPAARLAEETAKLRVSSGLIADGISALTELRLAEINAAGDSVAELFSLLLIAISAAVVIAAGVTLFFSAYLSSFIRKAYARPELPGQQAGVAGGPAAAA